LAFSLAVRAGEFDTTAKTGMLPHCSRKSDRILGYFHQGRHVLEKSMATQY
jgi:hypothetical protein